MGAKVGRFAGNGAADRPGNLCFDTGVVVGPLKPLRDDGADDISEGAAIFG